MLKAVYKNYKTGLYYAFDKKEDQEKPSIYTVYVEDNVYDAKEQKVDKNGKVYKLLDIELVKTKNGFDVYRPVKNK